jgi:spore coat protein U-like protein
MRYFLAPALMAFCSFAWSGAEAATATGSFNVQVTIAATCVVTSATNLNFGTQGVLAANVDQTSTINVTDAGRTVNWGNTVGTDTVAATGTGSAQPFTVFGRIPPQVSPLAAVYTDTITVTVTY